MKTHTTTGRDSLAGKGVSEPGANEKGLRFRERRGKKSKNKSQKWDRKLSRHDQGRRGKNRFDSVLTWVTGTEGGEKEVLSAQTSYKAKAPERGQHGKTQS